MYKRPFVLVLEDGLSRKTDITIKGLIFDQLMPLSLGSKSSPRLIFSQYVGLLTLLRKCSSEEILLPSSCCHVMFHMNRRKQP